jgi:hypothetical protein
MPERKPGFYGRGCFGFLGRMKKDLPVNRQVFLYQETVVG